MTYPARADEPLASIDDFRVLTGDHWSGSLTYLDYGSDRRVSIPVAAKISVSGKSTLKYAIRYPGEEDHNSRERIKVSGNGRKIDGKTVIQREQSADGTITLTTASKGKDNNRSADIHTVYVIAPNEFSILTNVRYSGDAAFFNRNEYRFTREQPESGND